MRGRRREKGQVFAPLGATIGVLIIGVLGIFAFEIGRLAIARDQLRAATDAAALAGAATLASSDLGSPVESHQQARAAAEEMFRLNDVFGLRLNELQQGQGAPKAKETKLVYRWLDPNNNNAEVAETSDQGRILEVEATFGYQPLFPALFGAAGVVFPLNVSSQGGVPDLDVVVCFDISGSMDDQTKVTLVKRRWDAVQNKIVYDRVREGVLFDIWQPGPLGTRANAHYPQLINFAPPGTKFSAKLRGEEHGPPGNHPDVNDPDAVTDAADANAYTDIVVNLDGEEHYASFSKDGVNFTDNIGVLVEAARGNLNNASVFNDSKANTALAAVTSTRSDFQSKYDQFAKELLEPIAAAKDASKNFFDVMQKNTVARFGIVTFTSSDVDGTSIGADKNSYKEVPRVAYGYVSALEPFQAPAPRVDLSASPAVDNYTDCKDSVDAIVSCFGTEFTPALTAALDSLKANGRKNAKKAILLFTDGQANDINAARDVAKLAKDAGIPIFTIGLSQIPDIEPLQKDNLTDQDGSQGLAFLSGNGARFFHVKKQEDLRAAFEEVARHLTQLVR